MTHIDVQPTTTYVVVYSIPERPEYVGGSTRVSLIEGYTDFEDIRVLIALQRGVKPEQIQVSSLALLAN